MKRLRLNRPGIFRLFKRAAFALFVVVLFGAVVTTDGFDTLGALPFGDRGDRIRHSPQYQAPTFVNAEPTTVMAPNQWPEALVASFQHTEYRAPTCPLPLVDGSKTLASAPESGLRVTWLGHSSTVIEIDGHAVLTDPMWSERASPSSAVGPKRFHPPPLKLASLPKLDAVVISHDHYDHLDRDTVKQLADLGLTFHVGLGVGAHLIKWGVPKGHVIEHDWWEPTELNGLNIISVPARHFSGRAGIGNDRTLWTSWVLTTAQHRVYFSGDTGLHQGLYDIQKRLGPFDLAMVEIGQYHPTWGSIHVGPHGALEVQSRLQAKRLLPIHWSTFVLGLHDWSEPAETLYVEAQKKNVDVVTPRLGEPIEPLVSKGEPWWRALPPIAPTCPSPTTVSSSR